MEPLDKLSELHGNLTQFKTSLEKAACLKYNAWHTVADVKLHSNDNLDSTCSVKLLRNSLKFRLLRQMHMVCLGVAW